MVAENNDLRAKLAAARTVTPATVRSPCRRQGSGAGRRDSRGEPADRWISRRRRCSRGRDSSAPRRSRSSRGRGLQGGAASVGARHQQRRRGSGRSQGGGVQIVGTARTEASAVETRPAEPESETKAGRQLEEEARTARRQPRLGDRGQARRAARRHAEGEGPPRRRGREPPCLRARVPQPPEELLHQQLRSLDSSSSRAAKPHRTTPMHPSGSGQPRRGRREAESSSPRRTQGGRAESSDEGLGRSSGRPAPG
jgi:hypothetical protein